ncbi:MAG: carboxypeptidase-like regulatory domain-containing protein [Thermofilum sp.]
MRAVALAFVLLLLAPVLAQPTVRIRAENGEPMLGARVRIVTLDGQAQEFELGAPVLLKDIVLGTIKVEVISWKGVPIGYATDFFRVYEDMTIRVPGVSTAEIEVKGSRGQALSGARVEIYYGGRLVESGTTDAGGVYRTTLPPATYLVVAEYGGRRVEASARLPGKASLSLDVFINVAGVTLSSSEFAGTILLIILVVLALVIITYEYAAWRRRRLARVITSAGGG